MLFLEALQPIGIGAIGIVNGDGYIPLAEEVADPMVAGGVDTLL